MSQPARKDSVDSNNALLSRNNSIVVTNDRITMSALSPTLSISPSVEPPPAYIAASAAKGIVTGDYQTRTPTFTASQHVEPASDIVLISPGSLALINGFLDQLLFDFLCTARSTSLASLRPAVAEILKPRLAKDAIAGADDELKEFLGGGDEEELTSFHGGQEPRGGWDLELIWKITRLRCMVYTRLGDMEEDDEDDFLEREQLDGARRFSSHLGTVSPAAAIFLTSIIEFVGEQTLVIAGEAARNRFTSRPTSQDRPAHQMSPGSPKSNMDRLVVDESDTEKIALDRTYGRLWRTWRRRVRTHMQSTSRPLSRESFYRRSHSSMFSGSTSRKSSVSTAGDNPERDDFRIQNVAAVLQENDPANVPLPMTENDIDEIEIPGLADFSDEVGDRLVTSKSESKVRPQSLHMYPSGSVMKNWVTGETDSSKPKLGHTRSYSLPGTALLAPADGDREDGEDTFVTPMETTDPIQETEPLDHDEGLQTPTAESHGIEKGENANRDSQLTLEGLDDVPDEVAAAEFGSATVVAVSRSGLRRSHLGEFYEEDEKSTEYSASGKCGLDEGAVTAQQVEIDLDTKDLNLETPVATGMNVPQISQHMVGELSIEQPQSKRSSRASDIYVYVKEPHHGRDPSLTTTEAGEEDDYRQDSLHEHHMQGVADPEDLALSDREDSAEQTRKAEKPKSFELRAVPEGKRRSGETIVPRGDVMDAIDSFPARPKAADSRAPPLTPLQELIEAAQETPDGVSQWPSTTGQQHDTVLYHQYGMSEHPQSVSYTPHKNHSSSANKTPGEHRNHVVVLPPNAPFPTTSSRKTSTERERVNVQRATPKDTGTPRSKRTGSIDSMDKRPHTSGSTTSRVSRKQTLPLRTSSDEAGAFNGDDSFDNLLRSGQTVQYTLTPQNMRDMEIPDSPRWNKPRSQTAELADFFKNTAPPDDDRPKSGRSGFSAKAVNGLASHPPNAYHKQSSQPTTSAKTKSSDIIATTEKSKKKLPGVVEARDARVGGNKSSTRDFADFIRSTGPDRPEQLPSAIGDRPPSATQEGTPRPSNAKSIDSSKALRGYNISPSSTSRSSTPKRLGSKLEARPAALPQGNRSSDLIDFIREGPPHDPRDGTHRIPRAIAPFRSTMDSDEISALGVGPGLSTDKDIQARISLTSTQESSIPTVSVHSSMNSRTGLLDSANHAGKRNNNPSALPWTQPSQPQDDGFRPQRKQRRVRDPYAIDTDSEDEDLFASPKPRQEEESLVDFLQNVPPPSESQTTPQLLNSPATAAVLRKTSSPNLRDRVMRKSSVDKGIPGSSKRRQRAESNTLPARRSSNQGLTGDSTTSEPIPHAASPHSSQTGSRLDSDRSMHPKHTPRARSSRPPQVQARSGKTEVSSSADLADFLKNSGPPPGSDTNSSATGKDKDKEENGFVRMFSRRKK